jgi:hypothetical protein
LAGIEGSGTSGEIKRSSAENFGGVEQAERRRKARKPTEAPNDRQESFKDMVLSFCAKEGKDCDDHHIMTGARVASEAIRSAKALQLQMHQ